MITNVASYLLLSVILVITNVVSYLLLYAILVITNIASYLLLYVILVVHKGFDVLDEIVSPLFKS